MLNTGEVLEVTNNVAFGLIDSKEAVLLEHYARPSVNPIDGSSTAKTTYPTRQLNAQGSVSRTGNLKTSKEKGYKIKDY